MAGAIATGVAEEITLPSGTPTAIVGSINSSATGSTFVCAIRDYSAGITAVTDNKSNTYARLGSALTISSNELDIWICYNGTGGSTHRPTITKSSGDLAAVSFFEITGCATASTLDVVGAAVVDSSSPFNVTVTTTNASDFVVTIGASTGSAATITTTPGAGFTNASVGNWVTGTNGLGIALMYQNVSSTGTYGGNFTQSSGTSAGVQTFALKQLAAGGGVVGSNYYRQVAALGG